MQQFAALYFVRLQFGLMLLIGYLMLKTDCYLLKKYFLQFGIAATMHYNYLLRQSLHLLVLANSLNFRCLH